MKCIWKNGAKCAGRSIMYSTEYRYLPVYYSYPVTAQVLGLHSATRQICYGIPSEKQLLYELRVAHGHFPGVLQP